ncbi:MAG: flagellar hook capping FlgD N-terminal domain-containing protein [Candidatus Latescibacteria bacterium]|nr:flagellar hook capping FlgD N-terminal domain-containing protein [Candidatus Latescibacterota bacterium]
MIVNSVSTTPTTSTAERGSAEELKNEFLKLLITQIKNQDPLKPLDNAEFTSQLAQLSTLEQLQAMNDSMTQDLVYTQSLNNTMMLGLVGRTAVVEGDGVAVQDGEAAASHLQSEAAGVATVTVRNESGAVVRTFTQTVAAGWSDLSWDGLGTDGQPVADGDYTLDVEVTDGEGAEIQSVVYMSGLVESIRFENNLALLHIAGRDYYASEIARVGV